MLAILISLAGACASASAETGVVTWIHPDGGPGCLKVESAVDGVSASLQAADGKPIGSPEELRAAGWHVAPDGLWETPPRAGGGKLTVAIRGLLAGAHRVSLRFFSQPRVPGNEWWYLTQAGLDGAKAQSFDYRTGTIIQGTGGHDPRTLYEATLGQAGSEEDPATSVSLWFQRYEWSQIARVGSIRVETTPSMQYAATQETTAENEAARAALLAFGPPPAKEGQRAYGVAVVSGTLKVRPKSFAALQGRSLGREIEMAAARGEYENRQVLVYSPSQSLESVRLEASPLRGPGGAAIATRDLLFAPVGYCPYSVPEDLSVHGYWPEPILTFLETFTVRRHDVQSLWLRVRVPRDAKPGEYAGSVTIRPGNAPACTVPVRVKVWDLDTPLMSHLRVVVGINRSDDFEMSYKLNPSTIYGFDDKWLDEMPKWAEAGATAINLGYIWGKEMDQQTKLPTEEQLDEWLDQIGRRYEAATKAGLRDPCYVYLFDEATSEWHPAMRRVANAIAERFPDLMLLTTAHDAAFGDKSGLQSIKAWCPLLPKYDRAAAAEARRRGKQVWWYTCNSPQKPFPNLMMTHPLMDARLLMGFMALAYQTDGFLYYSTVFGYFRPNTPAIESGPYTRWAIKDNAHDHLYQKGPQGPLPSLRLEAIRDGLEDYDLLFAARAQRDALRRRGVTTPALAELEARITPYFEPGNPLVQSLTQYSQAPDQLETARRALAEYCLAATTALAR